MPRREIIHLGSEAFQNALEVITDRIDHEGIIINSYNDKLEGLSEDTKTTTSRKTFKDRLAEAEALGIEGKRVRVPR